MYKIPSLVGQTFGRWSVLGRDGANKHHQATWVVRCACGARSIRSGATLRSGDSTSCGCWAKESVAMRNKNSLRNQSRHVGSPERNRVLSQYKSGAKSRGLAWLLTEEEFAGLTKGSCFYCGSLPAAIQKNSHNPELIYVYNGIDRKDNTQGYTKDNSVSCCTLCNRWKSNLTETTFLAQVMRIAAYSSIESRGLCPQ